MRRIVLSIVLASAASLAACSGGGTVLNTGGTAPNYVAISPYFAGQGAGVSNTTNTFAVAQGKSITVKANSFTSNGGLVNSTFHWTAALVNSGSYNSNSVQTPVACPTTVNIYPNPFPAAPAVPAATAVKLGGADLSNNIAVQPEDSSVATFNAPAYIAIAPPPVGTQYGSANTTPATTPPSYCVVISAIANNGATGSVTAFAQAF